MIRTVLIQDEFVVTDDVAGDGGDCMPTPFSIRGSK
jgi:hypothetical protein